MVRAWYEHGVTIIFYFTIKINIFQTKIKFLKNINKISLIVKSYSFVSIFYSSDYFSYSTTKSGNRAGGSISLQEPSGKRKKGIALCQSLAA
jgi:hypothetical protein